MRGSSAVPSFRPATTWAACAYTLLLALVAPGFSRPSPAHASSEVSYRVLAEACRKAEKPLFLAEDHSFLCFDGQVVEDRDYSMVGKLRSGGAFVVRSQGGNAIAALKIALALEQKRATVIAYDYCLSACASYFSIAADRTHVVKDSIVAWHDWSTGELDCPNVAKVQTPYGEQWQLSRALCATHAQTNQIDLTKYRQALAMQKDFYARRTFKDQVTGSPQSVYMRKALLRMYEVTGKYRDALWTWNPRYHKAALKTEVTYEAYPETQEALDYLARRLGIASRILHDP